MYVTKKKINKTNSYSVQIIKSIRVDGKVRKSTVQYIGHARDEQELNQFIALGKNVKEKILAEKLSNEQIAEYILQEKSRIKGLGTKLENCDIYYKKIVGLHKVFFNILEKINLKNIVNDSSYNKVLQDLIVARIYKPSSKRHSIKLLQDFFNIEHSLSNVYRAMDVVNDDCITKIKTNIYSYTKKLLNNKINVLFYDATTLYFESFNDDELRKCGYSKDLKFNQPQVLLTVMVTEKGLPIGYEVFSGSTYEGHTLKNAIEILTNNYPDIDFVFVADSGMLNQDNIDFLEEKKINYILGARLKNQTKKITEEILSIDKSKEEFKTIKINDTKRLVLSYKEVRAKKDSLEREKSITRVKDKLEKSKNPKNLLNNFRYKKYINITGETKIDLDEEKIKLDSKWDGLHGIITNVKNLKPEEIYAHYHGLWQVEDAFRVNKTDLKIRPIYHWTESRVKSHLALSYIAFSCIRVLQYLLMQNHLNISCRNIIYYLSRVEQTVVKDRVSEKLYCMSTKIDEISSEIFKTLELSYKASTCEISA